MNLSRLRLLSRSHRSTIEVDPYYSLPYHSFTEGLVNKFMTGELPPGYIGLHGGKKGSNGDWGELCLTFPIIIYMMTFMTLVTLLGFIYFYFYCSKKIVPGSLNYKRDHYYWRIIIIILLIVLLCSVFFGAYISIRANYALRYYHQANDGEADKRSRSLNRLMRKSYRNLIVYTDYAATEFVEKNLMKVREEVNFDWDFTDSTIDKIQNIQRESQNILMDVDLARQDLMQWSDMTRLFYGNVSTDLVDNDPGIEMIYLLDLKTLYASLLHLDALKDIEKNIVGVKFILNEISKNLEMARDLPRQIEDQIMETANTYGNYMRNTFAITGKQLEEFSNKLSKNERATKTSISSSLYITKFLTVCVWISCITIIMITVILLIAVLLGFCAWQFPGKWQLRKIGIVLLQSGIILIFCCYGLFGLSVLWHFFHGVVLHNNVSEEDRATRALRTSTNVQDNNDIKCAGNYTIFDILKGFGIINEDHEIDVPPIEYVHVPRNVTSNFPLLNDAELIKLVDEKLSMVEVQFESDFVCSEFQDLLLSSDTRLNDTYDKLIVFVSDIENSLESQRYSIRCHLNRLQPENNDATAENDGKIRLNNMAKTCGEITKFFEGGIEHFFGDAIAYLEQVSSFYSNGASKRIVENAVTGLDTFYANESSHYVHLMGYALENELGLCKTTMSLREVKQFSQECKKYAMLLNGVWSGIFLILCLFLPILFLAMLLMLMFPLDGIVVRSQKSIAKKPSPKKSESKRKTSKATSAVLKNPGQKGKASSAIPDGTTTHYQAYSKNVIQIFPLPPNSPIHVKQSLGNLDQSSVAGKLSDCPSNSLKLKTWSCDDQGNRVVHITMTPNDGEKPISAPCNQRSVTTLRNISRTTIRKSSKVTSNKPFSLKQQPFRSNNKDYEDYSFEKKYWCREQQDVRSRLPPNMPNMFNKQTDGLKPRSRRQLNMFDKKTDSFSNNKHDVRSERERKSSFRKSNTASHIPHKCGSRRQQTKKPCICPPSPVITYVSHADKPNVQTSKSKIPNKKSSEERKECVSDRPDEVPCCRYDKQYRINNSRSSFDKQYRRNTSKSSCDRQRKRNSSRTSCDRQRRRKSSRTSYDRPHRKNSSRSSCDRQRRRNSSRTSCDRQHRRNISKSSSDKQHRRNSSRRKKKSDDEVCYQQESSAEDTTKQSIHAKVNQSSRRYQFSNDEGFRTDRRPKFVKRMKNTPTTSYVEDTYVKKTLSPTEIRSMSDCGMWICSNEYTKPYPSTYADSENNSCTDFQNYTHGYKSYTALDNNAYRKRRSDDEDCSV